MNGVTKGLLPVFICLALISWSASLDANMPYELCHTEDTKNDISGFYGPGVLLAWCVTLSVTICGVELCILRDCFLERPHRGRASLDGEAAAACAYSLIAAGDFAKRTARREAGPMILAPLFVTVVSFLLADFCLLVHLYRYFFTLNYEEPPHRREYAARGLFWICVASICGSSFIPSIYNSSGLGVLDLPIIFYGILGAIPPLFSSAGMAILGAILSVITLPAYSYMIVMLGIQNPRYDVDGKEFCVPYTKLTLPQSPARLIELDQMAAVALALVQVCLPLFKKRRSL